VSLVAFRAIPYVEAQRFADSHPDSPVRHHVESHTRYLAKSYDHVWVISVTEADPRCEPIYKSETADVLPLQFDDVDADQWNAAGIPLFYNGKRSEKSEPVIIFTIEQARKACAFIKKAHAEPGHDILVVNCMAGVSRSGAIVTFARQVCGASYDLLHQMNPHIVPNAFVGRLLREAWSEM